MPCLVTGAFYTGCSVIHAAPSPAPSDCALSILGVSSVGTFRWCSLTVSHVMMIYSVMMKGVTAGLLHASRVNALTVCVGFRSIGLTNRNANSGYQNATKTQVSNARTESFFVIIRWIDLMRRRSRLSFR